MAYAVPSWVTVLLVTSATALELVMARDATIPVFRSSSQSGSVGTQEIEEHAIDLLRPLLVDEVARSGDAHDAEAGREIGRDHDIVVQPGIHATVELPGQRQR